MSLVDEIEHTLSNNPSGLSVKGILAAGLPRHLGLVTRAEVHRELGNLILRDRVQCIPGPTDDTTIYKWIPQ